jgi:hypothetical protein
MQKVRRALLEFKENLNYKVFFAKLKGQKLILSYPSCWNRSRVNLTLCHCFLNSMLNCQTVKIDSLPS